MSERNASAALSVASGTSYPACCARTNACVLWIDCHGDDGRPRAHHDQPPSSFWSAARAAMSASTRAFERRRVREPGGVERIEHVAQRGDRHDPRGVPVGSLVRVVLEVDHGVGQRLERGRRRADLEPAELREHAGGRHDRLADRAARGGVVDHAVGRERLGRGRRVDRQLDDRGVRPHAVGAGGGDAEAGGADLVGAGREAHLDPVVGGHRHPLAGGAVFAGVGEHEVRALHDDVDVERGVGLVLDDDRELEAVAEVEEARRRRAHHHRQAGGDRRLALAEPLGAVDRDRHHAVAGEAVRQRHVDGDRAVTGGGLIGRIDSEHVEVLAHVDLRCRLLCGRRRATAASDSSDNVARRIGGGGRRRSSPPRCRRHLAGGHRAGPSA